MSSQRDPPSLHQISVEGEENLRLREDERALLEEECASLLEQPLPESSRITYGRLLGAIEEGEIPPELKEALQPMLEVGLQSGRIRALYGAHAEMAASRLYLRLPRGKQYKASIDSANEALQLLAGQSLVGASFQGRGPGAYTLTVDTGGRRVTIRITRDGLSVDNVEAVI